MTAFTGFLDDGRICLTKNAAERALRGLPLGRRSWLFAGSDRSGARVAMIYSLIMTARMNALIRKLGSLTCLAALLIIPSTSSTNLLPWCWQSHNRREAA